MTPALYPAFSFVPRFTSRNMEICRRKWVQSLWGNLMSSCHLERTEKTGVGCLDISLHSPGKGRKRGAWARMLPPSPFAPHSGSHGQTGRFFLRPLGDEVLFVNSIAIPALSGRAFPLSALQPPGRPKWVRAAARNCSRRIAGRDACPTRGWVKPSLQPFAADGPS